MRTSCAVVIILAASLALAALCSGGERAFPIGEHLSSFPTEFTSVRGPQTYRLDYDLAERIPISREAFENRFRSSEEPPPEPDEE